MLLRIYERGMFVKRIVCKAVRNYYEPSQRGSDGTIRGVLIRYKEMTIEGLEERFLSGSKGVCIIGIWFVKLE